MNKESKSIQQTIEHGIICRPINSNENDLLIGNEQKNLIIKNLDGLVIASIPSPADGWTHEKLESINYYEHSESGWDAYLGNDKHWIGSSEV